ncbi:MAG: hypothetical protein MIO90_01845, partial [Methanomassiliicoccales archaeon]|nr:hypothetical protein [Methanomassiliicoccales archaeon]
ITPTQAAVEFFYGLLMALALSNTLRLALIGQPAEEISFVITVAILGCNAAWGIADGVVNVLTTHYQNLYFYRMIKSIKDGKDCLMVRELAAEVLSEALTNIQDDVFDDETRRKMAEIAVRAIKRKDVVRPRLGRGHFQTAIWCLILNVAAALPFVLIYQLAPFITVNLTTLVANVSGGVLLFMLGSLLDRQLGGGQNRLSWVMVGLGMFMLVVIVALGG